MRQLLFNNFKVYGEIGSLGIYRSPGRQVAPRQVARWLITGSLLETTGNYW
jgi:hypothetical protein